MIKLERACWIVMVVLVGLLAYLRGAGPCVQPNFMVVQNQSAPPEKGNLLIYNFGCVDNASVQFLGK